MPPPMPPIPPSLASMDPGFYTQPKSNKKIIPRPGSRKNRKASRKNRKSRRSRRN